MGPIPAARPYHLYIESPPPEVLTRHPCLLGREAHALTWQGVKRSIQFGWQDVHDTCINQISTATQKGRKGA